jgi:hypothetical protein
MLYLSSKGLSLLAWDRQRALPCVGKQSHKEEEGARQDTEKDSHENENDNCNDKANTMTRYGKTNPLQT